MTSKNLRHAVYPTDQIDATWEVNDVSPSLKKKACALGKTLGTNQDLNLQVHFNVYVDSTLQPQIQKHRLERVDALTIPSPPCMKNKTVMQTDMDTYPVKKNLFDR
jgi:hypothetical protein